jgi:hypothetical protein
MKYFSILVLLVTILTAGQLQGGRSKAYMDSGKTSKLPHRVLPQLLTSYRGEYVLVDSSG